jgi:hypothetical protein
MIDDMASLKQAMEQMDADDVAVAEAAKERAAQILSDAKLSFSKMAELIEQRRLLLRPKIVTSIKRMDQPHALGDAAFRDTGASLRREGQSFRQIAEALELNGGTTPRYEDTVQRGNVLYQMEMESEPDGPAWPRAPTLVKRIVLYPFRHPIRFLVIALLAIMLFNGLRDFAGVGRRISGYVGDVSAAREHADAAMSSVSSFVEKRIMRPSQEAAAPPTSTAPIPSPSPANSPPPAAPSTAPAVTSTPPATAPLATAPDSSASKSAPPAPPPTAPASPTAQTPRLDPRGVPPSNPAAKDRPQTAHPRTLEDMMPARIRRKSQMAGPCIGGVGGCYWGGGQY